MGWDPAQLDGLAYRAISESGTKGSSADGQQLDGNPIFAVPAKSSKDYMDADIAEGTKHVPLGIRVHYQPGSTESTCSQMLDSTSELVNSWELTLGLSAGVEKVLSMSVKGTYHEKLEHQREQETRYNVARSVRTDYALLTEIQNLRLDDGYKAAVLSNLKMLLTPGDAPEWRNFVQNYGTHYVHALTFGQTDFAETQCSMDAEATAWEQGFKLEANAKGTVEGIKLGAEGGGGQTSGGKQGSKESGQVETHITIGEPGKPAAIFSDLRPAWELFSPLFFPPDLTESATDEQAAAPFIWHRLRASFKDYLEQQVGLNQPLDESLFLSYRPIILTVRPNLGDFLPRYVDHVRVAIGWQPLGGTKLVQWNNFCLPRRSDVGVDPKSYASAEVVTQDQLRNWFDPVPYNPNDPKQCILPGEETLFCTMAATPTMIRNGAGFTLSVAAYFDKSGYVGDPVKFELRRPFPLGRLEVHQGKDEYDAIMKTSGPDKTRGSTRRTGRLF